ncbi:MAG TPA: hypothetical protein VH107_11380 [Lacipirellulaceae bacterium]|nr:hypothetical protein [Lacipirellulaceae bacterium]
MRWLLERPVPQQLWKLRFLRWLLFVLPKLWLSELRLQQLPPRLWLLELRSQLRLRIAQLWLLELRPGFEQLRLLELWWRSEEQRIVDRAGSCRSDDRRKEDGSSENGSSEEEVAFLPSRARMNSLFHNTARGISSRNPRAAVFV